MADMLQMSYPEMENLSKAFSTASEELDKLNSDISNFLSDISGKIDEWKSKSTNLSGDAFGTQERLNSVKNETRNTWQGDQADRFDGETYPVVYDALTKFKDQLESFSSTLATLFSGLETTLNELSQSVNEGADNCSEDSTWIANYAEQHRSIG